MTDPELAALGGAIITAGGTVAAVLRWTVGQWATVRREDIAAAKESAKLKREADERAVDRQVATVDRLAASVNDHTAKDLAHHAEVKQSIVRLEAKVDAALDWRERTPPPPDDSQRRRTNPHGYRPPRPGEHDDH